MRNEESPEFRLLRGEDVPAVCDLMDRTDAFIHGVKSWELSRVLCADALAVNPKVAVVVSLTRGRVVGYVLVVIDSASYWRQFWLRHPVMGGLLFCRKAVNKLLRGRTSRCSSEHAWKESSPSIAKVVNIGVSEGIRGRGIGKGLYDYLFRVLAERGVRRVDANIQFDNLPSIRLHEAMGWVIERTATHLFATVGLRGPGASSYSSQRS